MNSKERVMTAVSLAQPDRVPMDFQANPWVIERLNRELRTSTHKELLSALRSDIVDLRGVVDPVYCGPVPYSQEIGGGVKQNFWGWQQKLTETASGPEEMYCDFLLSNASALEELEAHIWPEVDWFSFADFSQRLDEWQDFAVMASGASVFQHPTFLRSMTMFMMDLAMNPEIAVYLIGKYTDFYVSYFDRMFTAAKGKIDILRCADDFGTQRGLIISPAMFKEFFAPRIKQLVDVAHSHDVKFMFHSCGAVVPLIDSLIEIGVDILDPLQAAAEGMTPAVLKEQFGSRICLHGSICTQYLLPEGSPLEVRQDTRKRIDILSPGGGFILAPCHVLQTDVPIENILAMSDTGFEHGRYATEPNTSDEKAQIDELEPTDITTMT